MDTKTSAAEFFYRHAGYSYDPKTQTAEQGRRECSTLLAEAEAWAKRVGVEYTWEADWTGEHTAAVDEPESCEFAYASWGVLSAGLGCIDDATDAYRRVIEAELASEIRSDWLANTAGRDCTPSTLGVLSGQA